jgi:hypothetical protein
MSKKQAEVKAGDEAETKRHIERKEETRNLKCVLTEAELLQAGRDMADAQNNVQELEAEADDWKSQHKAKMTVAEGRVSIKAGMIRSGYEYRAVPCEIIKDFDAAVIVTIRLDTSETIDSRNMTESERQMGLALEGGEDGNDE